MNKRLKSMEYILILGAIIILVSGLSFLGSSFLNTDLLKLLVMALITALLFGLSYVIRRILKLETSSKVYYYFGSVSILIMYLFIGIKGILGEWFSVDGEFSLFIASFFFLIILLASMIKVKYKEYHLINVIVLASLLTMFFLLDFIFKSSLYIYPLFALILFMLNIIKVKDEYKGALKVAAYLYGIASFFFILFIDTVPSSILFGSLVITILLLLRNKEDIETKLLSLIMLTFAIGSFFLNVAIEFDVSEAVVITGFAITIVELLLNFENIIKNKYLEIGYKVIINIFLVFVLLIGVEKSPVSSFIVTIFMLVSSLVNSYIFKRDKYEYMFIPFRLFVLIIFGLILLANYVEFLSFTLGVVIINLVLGSLYYFSKERLVKKEYMVYSLLSTISLVLFSELTITSYIIGLVLLLINYMIYFVNNKSNKLVEGRVFFTFILIYAIVGIKDLDINYIKYLVLSVILGLVLLFNQDDRYNFGITIPIFYLSVVRYIAGLEMIISLESILISLMGFVVTIAFASNVLKRESAKEMLCMLLFAINLFFLPTNEAFVLIIYSLVVSILIIVITLKQPQYKGIYYVGIVFVVINLFRSMDYLGELSTSLYLLIIGIIVVILMILLIYSYQKKLENKTEEEIKELKPRYCGECGEKIDEDDIFCSSCGNKLK